jgi:hypothetical protein
MIQNGFIAALVLMSCSAAFAQGSDSDRKACRSDVTRHCRAVMDKGDGAVLSCLQTNRQKLSRSCRKVLEDNGR